MFLMDEKNVKNDGVTTEHILGPQLSARKYFFSFNAEMLL